MEILLLGKFSANANDSRVKLKQLYPGIMLSHAGNSSGSHLVKIRSQRCIFMLILNRHIALGTGYLFDMSSINSAPNVSMIES